MVVVRRIFHILLLLILLILLSMCDALTYVFYVSFIETPISVAESVRGADVFIIQSGCGEVNNTCIETFILASTCRCASARRVVAVMPYYPYSKQAKQKKRGCIPAKLVAEMLKVAGW